MENEIEENIKEILYNFLKKNEMTMLSLNYLNLIEEYQVLLDNDVLKFEKEDYLNFIKDNSKEIEVTILNKLYNKNKEEFIYLSEEEITCFRNLNLITYEDFNAYYLNKEKQEKIKRRESKK